MDITLRMSDHALTARAAAAAGIVLLQNKNRTLPLLPQEDGAPLPVAVFGVKQLQTPAFDKTMTPWRFIGVLDGLAASETVRPDALLARKYRPYRRERVRCRGRRLCRPKKYNEFAENSRKTGAICAGRCRHRPLQ